MTPYLVPLKPQPSKFSITMAGVVYNLTVRWCAPNAAWTLDIADQNNGPLIQGIPLITGADLLAQYAYIGIAGELIVQSDFDPFAVPTFDNLGSNGNLYFVTNP